jgi:hypothetical protein
MDPDWLAGSRALLFTAQHGITFQTHRVAFDPETLAVERETPSDPAPAIAQETHDGAPQRYARQLGLDLVQNGIAFDPALGSGGGGQIALSDMLGNEQLYLYLSNDSQRFGNFWDGFEGGLTYYNRGRRLNYGLGVYRLTQLYDAQLDVVRRERRVGVVGLAAYPFDKFTRIEGSVLLRHASDHRLQNGMSQNVDLISNFLSLVYDNSRWGWSGPAMGRRLMVSAGFTRDLTTGAGDFGTLLAEIREYHTIIPGVVSATRLVGQSSVGRDAQRYYLGGPFSLRGYDRRSMAGVQTMMLQEEIRFPLLRGMVLAIPSAWMLPTVNGAVFANAAWAWDYGPPRQLGSAGTSLFIGGGYFPALRWDWAWRTDDFQRFGKQVYRSFSVGFNF